MLGLLLQTNMWFSAFLGIWALPVLSHSAGVSKLTGNPGNSIKFGLPLLISRGGARSNIKFIQLNYCCQEPVPELSIYGSNFTNVDMKAQEARNTMKKKVLDNPERLAQSRLAALAKSWLKPILAQIPFWENTQMIMIILLEL